MTKMRKFKQGENMKVGDAFSTKQEENIKDIQDIVCALDYKYSYAREIAACDLHAILSKGRRRGNLYAIDAAVKAGVVPKLVEILKTDMLECQFEAAWSLATIIEGSSEYMDIGIYNGAVPLFVHLLSSVNEDVQEQALWALGHIAQRSPVYRDLVLGHEAMTHVIAKVTEAEKLSVLKVASWTLANLCSGKPRPPFHQVEAALPVLAWLIHMQDIEMVTDACCALSFISNGSDERIQAVIDTGICPTLVELLSHSSNKVRYPVLRTVGNILAGDDLQAQVVIDCQVLPHLLNLLITGQEKSTKKEACFAISNITSGTTEQIQAVIDANIFPILLSLMVNGESEVRKEVAWAFSNATDGVKEQIKYLVSRGCMNPLCGLLTFPDLDVIYICLKALGNIFAAGEDEKNASNTDGVNVYAQLIDAYSFEKIMTLQQHEEARISEKAVEIVETYFGGLGYEFSIEEYDDEISSEPRMTRLGCLEV